MSAKYIRASEGKKYALTEKGFEIGRVRVKFEERSNTQYTHSVPSNWIENGWVQEVDDDVH